MALGGNAVGVKGLALHLELIRIFVAEKNHHQVSNEPGKVRVLVNFTFESGH